MLTTYARHVGFHPVNLLRTTRSRNLSHLFTFVSGVIVQSN